MIVIAFFGIIGGAGCTICSSKASMGFGTDIRKDMLDRIQNFSLSFFSLTKDLITLTPARFSLITVFTLSIFCWTILNNGPTFLIIRKTDSNDEFKNVG